MKYVGIDIHKRYSVCVAQDERGRRLGEARVEGNLAAGFAQFFRSLGGKSRVVIEACWNWQAIYDRLEGIAQVEAIQVANPYKARLIAEAQIKTDRLDANGLATLLRGNFIAPVHVPGRQARARKNLLRQRLYWARLRTRIRNRTHALLDRQQELQLPQCSDLFGARGKSFLRRLELAKPDALLLGEDMELLELIGRQIKEQERRIRAGNQHDALSRRLQSLPGMGLILSAVAAAEIDSIERFNSAEKLCAYAGLAPSTYSSGGNTWHGCMLPFCNKWLRWAFIEAAWVAVGCSGYFGNFYRRQKARGKKSNTAITIVARRMCRIAWALLREERDYTAQPPSKHNNFPGRSALRTGGPNYN